MSKDDYCLTPLQCGIGHDCSPCLENRISSLQSTVQRLESENKELVGILKVASCPNCDGSGAYYDNFANVCQCQWCYERDKLIQQHAGGEG